MRQGRLQQRESAGGDPGPAGLQAGQRRWERPLESRAGGAGQRKHAATYVGSSMAFVVILKRVLKTHSSVAWLKEMKASHSFFDA